MIVANGTNVKVNGNLEEVIAELLYLIDAVAINASETVGMDKKEWLNKIFEVVKNIEEDKNIQ